MVAFAGFAEEHSFDAAAGAKRFLDETDAFNADRAGFRGQTAAQRHAEFLEPAIVAAGEDARRSSAWGAAGGFAGGGHCSERSKLSTTEGNWYIRKSLEPKSQSNCNM